VSGNSRTDSSPAPISAALPAASIRPRSIPIAVAATMNGSDVACMSQATVVCRASISVRYTSAGRPRAASKAARKIETMTRFDTDDVSASRSKRTPLVTKNAGMKTPKPTASSLRRKSGWVITSSRSTSETIAPAMNAPRMTSRPSCSATAAKATNSRNAPRTRICAVVSCSRTRSSRMRIECSAPRVTTNTTTASANTLPRSSSVEPMPPSPEKKIDSRMIAPKSAIDAAATISCPKSTRSRPRP
jgi:hypothetical protein